MSRYHINQFVILTGDRQGLTGELAHIDREFLPGEFEVVLLNDHKPGSGWDQVRCVSGGAMRLATLEEIESKKAEWEKKHSHKLDSKVATLGLGYGVTA